MVWMTPQMVYMTPRLKELPTATLLLNFLFSATMLVIACVAAGPCIV